MGLDGSPAKAAATFFSSSMITLTMYCSLASLAAATMSLWRGLPSRMPVRA